MSNKSSTQQPAKQHPRKSASFFAAMAAAKLSCVALKVARRSGTNFPGNVAEKVCPGFLSQLDAPARSIVVTGSTGKTTTANMICDLLDAMGEAHISNRAGSNIRSGIETALLREATAAGSLKKPLAALELDERWSTYVLPHINPTVVVVTNLGRDSFHRNANVDVVFDVLDKSLDCGATLVLNGDDLISHELAANNDRRVYFGIARMPGDPDVPEGIICDRLFCPHCDSLLEWEFSHYNHIGRAHCPNCDYGSPALDYEMTGVDLDAGICTVCEHKVEGAPSHEYPIVGKDITDLYNELAAISGLREMGYSAPRIHAALKGVRTVGSRYEERQVGSRQLVRVLAKGQNPVAVSRSLGRIRRQPGAKAVVIMLDDARDVAESSEYTGWYYECDFEYLTDPSIRQVVIYGYRGTDLELRMMLAGIDRDKLVQAPSPTAAADAVVLEGIDRVCVAYDNYNGDICDECVSRLVERMGKD